MQPNGNRPVYIVQPTNITHLNVRPTIITTGGQQIPIQQQPIYQVSPLRQPVMTPQPSPLYQIQSQPRLVTSPAYASLPSQRFVTSPQQILATNTNISPRLITPQSAPRMSMTSSQATTSILRPTLSTVSTPPIATSSSISAQSQAAAAGSKEFAVKVPKTQAEYGIMEFANGISIDVKDWKAIEMRREINQYTYRPATNLDPNASSTSTTITTSLGAVLPKTGAGSEYGREQKEALKRKRYATKGTNIDDLPWLLTDRSSTEKKLKHYRGIKKGGVTTNSSYYVFIQGKDGFEAYPVEDWFAFTPTNVYKTLDFDEAEKQFQDRHKRLSKWFSTHQIPKENDADNEDEKEKKSSNSRKHGFKLLDSEEWVQDKNEDEFDDEEADEDDESKSNKKSKTNKKNDPKSKTSWTLSDDDEDETTQIKAKKPKKNTQPQTSEEQGEDSDDGDHEGDEIEYTSDESSEDEDDIKDAGTVKSAVKYEVKGIDEEMQTMADIEKGFEKMDENGGDFDFDDNGEEEEVPDIDENDEENGKTTADDLSDVGKLLKSDAVSKEMESSTDDDDLDDSDDPDKEPIEPMTSISTQPVPSQQVKTEKGHKKAREEEMRAIKSTVMSLPSTPSNPSDTITEDKVRSVLSRKQYMTFTELIQNFVPKTENLRTKEIKEGIVQKLASIIKRLNIEEKLINGKKHIKLKTT